MEILYFVPFQEFVFLLAFKTHYLVC